LLQPERLTNLGELDELVLLDPIEIEVIDAVKPYVAYLKEIFDFDAIKSYVHSDDSRRASRGPPGERGGGDGSV
jgi:phosphoglucomutase